LTGIELLLTTSSSGSNYRTPEGQQIPLPISEPVTPPLTTTTTTPQAPVRSRSTPGVTDGAEPVFKSVEELHSAIDDSSYGGAAWRELDFQYDGHVDEHSASWKKETYVSHARNTFQAVKAMVASSEFHGKWDTTPIKEYTSEHKRLYSNFMSGRWAWCEAVSSL
jgi:hypothetical protein